ncbi:unnamed protein product [Gongylonema pulchrum]|uniref:Uncharacterized protein n=1 Tax=Gongylonema pulchrum TaxID=637853 RepID=A0A183DE96_9BILA|nr:unnamed protein product [Gongylonema pulchrum]
MRTDSARSSIADRSERHERNKLQLELLTKPMDSKEKDLPARPTGTFGLAKPVDLKKRVI